MFKRVLIGCAALASAVAVSAQTVTVSLGSPQNGQTVTAGSAVNWTISFTVSSGNNAGLALLCADLVQDPANAELLDIPAAGGVPSAMTNFSRPAGISNPGEGGPTGYVGVKRGTAGAMNLIQIGGAQNNFGIARPAGSGLAESANVVGGVGQSGAVTLASGSIAAPATEGTYTYSLANVVANVLTAVNAPPNFSPAIEAGINVAAGSISFTVGGGCPQEGDVDCDGDVDLTDLSYLLTNFGATGGMTRAQGDLDGDADVDLTDLALLLRNFGL